MPPFGGQSLLPQPKLSFDPCAKWENFRYGENSFKKHVVEFEKLNLSYKQVFNKELYFELDNENDYLEFLKNKPRWYKKISD